jgi:hypothetical protein
MKKLFILSIALVLILGFTAAPALALYPPCQDLTYWLDDPYFPTSITYTVYDPVSRLAKPETWSAPDGGLISSVQVDKGILTWIVIYLSNYNCEIHYRIFDPGRGNWRADNWLAIGINDLYVFEHQVHDGVVAWKIQYVYGKNNGEVFNAVYYVTYSPDSGSWVLGEQAFDVPVGSPRSPETLSVKDGVVAWPMNPIDSRVEVHFTIFDYGLNKWVTGKDDLMLIGDWHLDYVTIVTTGVFIRYASTLPFTTEFAFYGYDPIQHTWGPNQSTTPHFAAFVAQPLTVVETGWVCFWDTSLNADPASRLATTWTFPGGYITNDVSPVHQFMTAGSYWIYQDIELPVGGHTPAQELVTVDELQPISGQIPGVEINNAATYTTSLNVSLSINGLSDSKEMCFQHIPGIIWWSAWEPYATSKSYQLSPFGMIGPGNPADGLQTVKVKFRNAAHVESPVYQASIIVDLTPPTGSVTLNDGQPTTANPRVHQAFTFSDANGVAGWRVAYLNAPFTTCIWGPWTTADFYPYSVKFNSNPGKKQVFLQVKDNAGNISQTYEASILLTKPLPFLPLLLGD